MNPLFSKASIVANIPVIQKKVAVMVDRLNKIKDSPEMLDLEAVYLALTTDVLTQCSYGWTYDYILHSAWAMTGKLVNTGGRALVAIV